MKFRFVFLQRALAHEQSAGLQRQHGRAGSELAERTESAACFRYRANYFVRRLDSSSWLPLCVTHRLEDAVKRRTR